MLNKVIQVKKNCLVLENPILYITRELPGIAALHSFPRIHFP